MNTMKKKKKITVSIGIPAYNEEKNIKNLLGDILGQKQRRWQLKEIIIYSDGSTDKTVTLANQIESPFIKIVTQEVRRGKPLCVNEIIRDTKGEIIVLFDADVRLAGKNVIERLLFDFENDEKVMLAGGNKKPFPPKNFLEEGIYSTFNVFYDSKINLNGGNNVFGCQGGCIAIRKKFAETIHLPDTINNDAFLYLLCKQRGYRFRYIDDAIVYYKMATNLKDYLKQLFRATPKSAEIFLKKYFGDLVAKEFHRPPLFYLTSIFRAFIARPLPTIFIILVNLMAWPFIPFMAKKYTTRWPIAESTK